MREKSAIAFICVSLFVVVASCDSNHGMMYWNNTMGNWNWLPILVGLIIRFIGDYHNGCVWPFICGFYIAALVASDKFTLADKTLMALTHTVQKSKNQSLEFGFNEWHKAQTGKPMGQNWQTWSAANCVETRKTFL